MSLTFGLEEERTKKSSQIITLNCCGQLDNGGNKCREAWQIIVLG